MKIYIKPGSESYPSNSQYIDGVYSKVETEFTDVKYISGEEMREVYIQSSFSGKTISKKEIVPHWITGVLSKSSFMLNGRLITIDHLTSNYNDVLPKYIVKENSWGIRKRIPCVCEIPINNDILASTQYEMCVDINILNCEILEQVYEKNTFLVHNTTGEQLPINRNWDWDLYEIVDGIIKFNSEYSVLSKEQIAELNKEQLQAGWYEYSFIYEHTTNKRGWKNLIVDGVIWEHETSTDTVKFVSVRKLGNGGGRYYSCEYIVYIKEGSEVDVIVDSELEEYRKEDSNVGSGNNPFEGLSNLFK